jgi:hypothetical protein
VNNISKNIDVASLLKAAAVAKSIEHLPYKSLGFKTASWHCKKTA